MAKNQQHQGPAYWLIVQQKFMAERGTTAAGYINFYIGLGETDMDRVRSIYAADRIALEKLALQAARGGWSRS
jgi:hypothetical protein